MVEGANTNPTKKIDSTKILGVVFCMLCALVFGLTVAIIVVRVVGKGGENPGGESTSFLCSDYSEITEIAQCVRESYEYSAENEKAGMGDCTGVCNEYAKAITKRIEADQPVDKYDYIVKIFDSFTLAVNDDASAAALIFVRNQMLLKLEKSSEHMEDILADTIKADEVLKTPASADEVIVMAYSIGKTELAEQYLKIKKEREFELGIDSEGGQG